MTESEQRSFSRTFFDHGPNVRRAGNGPTKYSLHGPYLGPGPQSEGSRLSQMFSMTLITVMRTIVPWEVQKLPNVSHDRQFVIYLRIIMRDMQSETWQRRPTSSPSSWSTFIVEFPTSVLIMFNSRRSCTLFVERGRLALNHGRISSKV